MYWRCIYCNYTLWVFYFFTSFQEPIPIWCLYSNYQLYYSRLRFSLEIRQFFYCFSYSLLNLLLLLRMIVSYNDNAFVSANLFSTDFSSVLLMIFVDCWDFCNRRQALILMADIRKFEELLNRSGWNKRNIVMNFLQGSAVRLDFYLTNRLPYVTYTIYGWLKIYKEGISLRSNSLSLVTLLDPLKAVDVLAYKLAKYVHMYIARFLEPLPHPALQTSYISIITFFLLTIVLPLNGCTTLQFKKC